MYGWQLQEALMRDPRAARALVCVYTMDECWPLSVRFPAGYLINTAHSGARDYWMAVFLKDPKRAEYFNSYSTVPLESIYKHLWEMDFWDILLLLRYGRTMIHGPLSRYCGLYTFYFLVMCSQGESMGWSPVYSESMTLPTMRPQLEASWDSIYMRNRPWFAIRTRECIRNSRCQDFVTMESTPSQVASGLVSSSIDEVHRPCAWSMMTCWRQATTLVALIWLMILLCYYSPRWTANQRPGNMRAHSQCRTWLMCVGLYSTDFHCRALDLQD